MPIPYDDLNEAAATASQQQSRDEGKIGKNSNENEAADLVRPSFFVRKYESACLLHSAFPKSVWRRPHRLKTTLWRAVFCGVGEGLDAGFRN